MKKLQICFFALSCLLPSLALQAHPTSAAQSPSRQEQPTSQQTAPALCSCGCGCLAPCHCGCTEGKPCNCHVHP